MKKLICMMILVFFAATATMMTFNVSENAQDFSSEEPLVYFTPPNPEEFDLGENNRGQAGYKDNQAQESNFLQLKMKTVPATVQSGPIHYVDSSKVPMAGSTEEALILLVQFQDESFDVGHDKTYFETVAESLKNYYEFNSDYVSGQSGISINYTVADIVTSSRDMAYYGGDSSGIDDANGHISELTREALLLLDNQGFDFSPYDSNGYIDNILIIHAGSGQEEGGSSDNIWSHASSIQPSEALDGTLAKDYIMFPESCQLGVVSHEFGHAIGLPDLYDTDDFDNGLTFGIGSWGIMGSGSWNHKDGEPAGSTPSGLSPWSREYLGWVDTIPVVADQLSLTLNNTSGLSTVAKVWPKGSIQGKEYYLVEYRKQIGYDEALPGEGVLIWHIDDEFVELAYDVNMVNAFKGRIGVEIEQADGYWDLWVPHNNGDNTDPFGGSGQNNHFSAVPYRLNYSNIYEVDRFPYSYLDILNIDVFGNQATMDIYLQERSPATAVNTVLPEDGSSDSQPTFVWDIAPQAEEYILEISESNTFDTLYKDYVLGSIDQGLMYDGSRYSFTLPEGDILEMGRTYYWRIAASNSLSGMNRLWSDVKTLETVLYDGAIYFDFEPYDILKHPDEPIIYFTDWNGKQLKALNMDTEVVETISFDQHVGNMTYHDNKLYVCMMEVDYSSQRYDSNGEQGGYFGIVDTSNMTLSEKIAVNTDPYSIAVDKRGYIYISSGSGQHTYLRSYDNITYTEIDVVGTISDMTLLFYSDTLDKVYGFKDHVSPRDYLYFDINTSGEIVDDYDSPYHGDYGYWSSSLMLPSGLQMLNGSGTVINLTTDRETNMMFDAQMSSGDWTYGFDQALVDQIASLILILEKDTSDRDPSVFQTYDLNDFSKKAEMDFAVPVQEMVLCGDELVFLEIDSSNYIIRRIPTSVYVNLGNVSISMDGDNRYNLMGATTQMEYSLDGGSIYKAVTRDNMHLSDEEIENISANSDLKIRLNQNLPGGSDLVKTIDIVSEDDIPSLVWNDGYDTLYGLDETMEYRIDEDEWVTYNAPITFVGDKRVGVRYAPTGLTLASEAVTIEFKEAVSDYNYLMNFEPGIVYLIVKGISCILQMLKV